MQKLLLFSLLYLASFFNAHSCGYYPYGEEVRFCLLKPNLVYPHSTNAFFYNTQRYSGTHLPDDHFQSGKNAENLDWWHKLLKEKASKEDIYYAVYQASSKELKRKKSSHVAIRILQEKENRAYLHYLLFAKKCSPFNGLEDDPWERNGDNWAKSRDKLIQESTQRAENSTSPELRKRYAHLAIRLAHYNQDGANVKKLYARFFDRNSMQSATDYWALHFKLQAEASSPERNVDVAMVITHSPEKRKSVSYFFDPQFSRDQMLASAKSKEERAALYFWQATTSFHPSLEELKGFGKNNQQEEHLLFLSLREINKLEDWILTPYYSLFEPTLRTTWSDTINAQVLLRRIEADRVYAGHFSNWLSEIHSQTDLRNAWWPAIRIYADFLAGSTKGIEARINQELAKKSANTELQIFYEKLLAVCTVVNSQGENLNELNVEELVLRYKHDNLFLFAIGKELEYKDNKVEAACVFSNINLSGEYNDAVVWKSPEHNHTLWSDYYDNYFFYMDATYTVNELENLIHYVKTTANASAFDQWKTEQIRKDLDRLYDLLGVKYMRKDELQKALKAFNQVAPSFWKGEVFQEYMQQDPFDNNFILTSYSQSDKSYTKPEIVEKLIKLKSRVMASDGDDKAYYAFQVANCYRNMTYYGNAWLMKRYYWSGNHYDAGLEDDAEYIEANFAKKYYLLAYKQAKTKQFAALALRLAGQCEKYALLAQNSLDYQERWSDEQMFTMNEVYRKLAREFPAEYEPLVSNCESLYTYFESIKRP